MLLSTITHAGSGSEAASASYADKLSGLPGFIECGMHSWGIPGMAVAVVKDNEIIYAQGFGERKLGSNDRVDEHTVFGMASLTKAMTAVALAMLVDEGRLSWDDRVRDHLSWFELSDPWVSDRVTISDLLSHRVGIGRMTGNRLRFMPSRDPKTIMSFVRHQPFEVDFRAGYLYSNIMYMVAGQVLEAVTGDSWDHFLSTRLFTPLEMHSANTSITRISDQDNAAWPHQEIHGDVVTIPRRNFDNVGPAASVNASVSDMAQWMILLLDTPGVFKGQELVSAQRMKEVFQPRHVFEMDDPFKDDFSAYGFGWGLRYYEEYRIAQHSGATDGMTSLLVLVPGKNLGVIVASNLFCTFRPAVRNYILDALLDLEHETDWHDHYFSQFSAEKAAALEERAEIENRRIPDTTPSLATEAYTGTYHHEVYDNAVISINDDGRLVMQLWDDDEMIADLEHWHYDTFRAHWRNPAMREKFITFDLDQYGEVYQVNVNFTLRQRLISAGIYPAEYMRTVTYAKTH